MKRLLVIVALTAPITWNCGTESKESVTGIRPPFGSSLGLTKGKEKKKPTDKPTNWLPSVTDRQPAECAKTIPEPGSTSGSVGIVAPTNGNGSIGSVASPNLNWAGISAGYNGDAPENSVSINPPTPTPIAANCGNPPPATVTPPVEAVGICPSDYKYPECIFTHKGYVVQEFNRSGKDCKWMPINVKVVKKELCKNSPNYDLLQNHP